MAGYSELERQIVQAIVAHIQKSEEISLTELARECHVAKSTVSRALQKLGYRGIGDLKQGLRIEAQTGAAPLLPRTVTATGVDAAAGSLARCLYERRHKKNLIFTGDRRTADLLASYLSRKLLMFEILASASYDYAMTVQGELEPGAAIFCFHKEAPGRAGLGQPDGYGLGMLAEARRAGFSIVVISDDQRTAEQLQADQLILITRDADPRCDFYLSKVIMLFEATLAKLSELRGGRL